MKITLNKKWRIGGWTQIASLLGGQAGASAASGAASQFASGAASGATAGAGTVAGAGAGGNALTAGAGNLANAPAGGGFASLLQNISPTGNATGDLMAFNQVGPAPRPQMGQADWMRLLMQ